MRGNHPGPLVIQFSLAFPVKTMVWTRKPDGDGDRDAKPRSEPNFPADGL
jgi:hypothetical protein